MKKLERDVIFRNGLTGLTAVSMAVAIFLADKKAGLFDVKNLLIVMATYLIMRFDRKKSLLSLSEEGLTHRNGLFSSTRHIPWRDIKQE